MEELEQHSLASVQAQFDDLQKRLMWAREDADMRKIALDSVTAERDRLRNEIDNLEQEFVILEDDRNRWRKAFLKQAEQFGAERNQP
jgi:uncharacterized coiled-coil DUF342 family protein